MDSNELAGFGMLVNAMSGGGEGGLFPRMDAEDFGRGARFIPGEVTVARRNGEQVDFITQDTDPNKWYWQMTDGSRIIHGGGKMTAEEVAALGKSGDFKPQYDETVRREASTTPGISGMSPRSILDQEAAAQRAVAENEKWLIARVDNSSHGPSRHLLEKLGFTILGESGDLFFEVQPPEGWTKSTDGYWTSVCDETGAERITQFYKSAPYDRSAFVNIMSGDD